MSAHTEASQAGVSPSTTPRAGQECQGARGLFGERKSKCAAWWTDARIAVAVDLYRNSMQGPADILAAINAVDPEVSPVPVWTKVLSFMTRRKILRHPGAASAANQRRGIKGDSEMVATIRKMVAEGATNPEICAAIGRANGSLVRIMKQHGVSRGQQLRARARALAESGMTTDRIAGALGRDRRYTTRLLREAGIASLPPGRPSGTPNKARSAAPPLVFRNEKRPPIVGAVQTVEEFLAAGGQVTRCPTVALLATQAVVPEADTAAVRAYYAAKPKGTWKEQQAARWNKAKREQATRAGR